MNITIVVGTRPNFMKVSPIIDEIERLKNKSVKINYRLVHTGQHYDSNMSDSFFNELKIPKPNVNLECKSGSHAVSTASIMISFEAELFNFPPDLVLGELRLLEGPVYSQRGVMVCPDRSTNKIV